MRGAFRLLKPLTRMRRSTSSTGASATWFQRAEPAAELPVAGVAVGGAGVLGEDRVDQHAHAVAPASAGRGRSAAEQREDPGIGFCGAWHAHHLTSPPFPRRGKLRRDSPCAIAATSHRRLTSTAGPCFKAQPRARLPSPPLTALARSEVPTGGCPRAIPARVRERNDHVDRQAHPHQPHPARRPDRDAAVHVRRRHRVLLPDRSTATARVDQLRDTGHYEMWQTDLKLVRELGLRYLRYGPPIYRILHGHGRVRLELPRPGHGRDAAAGHRADHRPGALRPARLARQDFQNPEWPKHFAEYAHALRRALPVGAVLHAGERDLRHRAVLAPRSAGGTSG